MNLLKKIPGLCGMACALAGLSSHAAGGAPETPCWQLPAEARVDSAGIFLGQIVTSTQPVVLPQIRLAPAPLVGQPVWLTREQVVALAQSSGVGLILTNWTGPARVRVARRTRLVTESEITDLLTAVLQSNYVKDLGELELRLSRPWTPALVADEPLTLTLTEMPANGVNPNFVAGFELWNGRERAGRWQAVLQAKIWRQVPLARGPLTRGQVLREGDLVMERRDVLTMRDTLLNVGRDGPELELAENVPAGLPLLNRSVRARPLVRRGQTVDAIYTAGSLTISLKVELMEDGLLGQTVRVRNTKTNRQFYGKIQNEESISITL